MADIITKKLIYRGAQTSTSVWDVLKFQESLESGHYLIYFPASQRMLPNIGSILTVTYRFNKTLGSYEGVSMSNPDDPGAFD